MMDAEIGAEEAINQFLASMSQREQWLMYLAGWLATVQAEWEGLGMTESIRKYPATLNFATAILDIMLSARRTDA